MLYCCELKYLTMVYKNIFCCFFILVVLISACSSDDDESSINDFEPPEISITGANPYYTAKDSTYNDPGATAFDAVDGDVTSEIVSTNNVNINVVGTYTVNYRVGDRAGNIADTFRVVKVEIFKKLSND